MHTDVILTSTKDILNYSGMLVKVVPQHTTPKLKFKLSPKKGCGVVVKV